MEKKSENKILNQVKRPALYLEHNDGLWQWLKVLLQQSKGGWSGSSERNDQELEKEENKRRNEGKGGHVIVRCHDHPLIMTLMK